MGTTYGSSCAAVYTSTSDHLPINMGKPEQAPHQWIVWCLSLWCIIRSSVIHQFWPLGCRGPNLFAPIHIMCKLNGQFNTHPNSLHCTAITNTHPWTTSLENYSVHYREARLWLRREREMARWAAETADLRELRLYRRRARYNSSNSRVAPNTQH